MLQSKDKLKKKVVSESLMVMNEGSEFQTDGAEHQKARVSLF